MSRYGVFDIFIGCLPLFSFLLLVLVAWFLFIFGICWLPLKWDEFELEIATGINILRVVINRIVETYSDIQTQFLLLKQAISIEIWFYHFEVSRLLMVKHFHELISGVWSCYNEYGKRYAWANKAIIRPGTRNLETYCFSKEVPPCAWWV